MPGLLSNFVRFFAPASVLQGANTTAGGTTTTNTTMGPMYTACDDASWAICHPTASDVLGNHMLPRYTSYIEECNKASAERGNPHQCEDDEIFRLDMNQYQPKSVYNFTKIGYKKIKAPPELFKLIREFYDRNRGKDVIEWKIVTPYHNMWESPPTIMTLNQDQFEGGGVTLQSLIWEQAQDILEEWSGQQLSPVSLYGIRLYHNGSILAPHVDRFPLITSAIINVDQDVDETWPLEVYGHDGKATNITMEPGDMVLYESHSVIHGRPFPLKGNFFANVFVHFEAVAPLDPNTPSNYDPVADLPPYLIPGSKWAATWRHQHPNGWKGKSVDARVAAQQGDAKTLQRLAKVDPTSFQTPDDLGWTPFHESIRAGSLSCVETILFAVGDAKSKLVNLSTYTGVTPLNIARQFLGEDHDVTQLLIKLGGVDESRNTNSDEL